MVWHYTTGHNLKWIVADGLIRQATAYVPEHERPATWFSLEQKWEPTAQKALCNYDGSFISLGMQGTYERAGLARIGVYFESAPHDWRAYKRMSGVSKKHLRALERVAHEQGATPAMWRVSFEPVPKDAWRAIDAWDGSVWQRIATNNCGGVLAPLNAGAGRETGPVPALKGAAA